MLLLCGVLLRVTRPTQQSIDKKAERESWEGKAAVKECNCGRIGNRCSATSDCRCSVLKGKKRAQCFVEQRARFCPRGLFRVVGRKQRGRELDFVRLGRLARPVSRHVMYATHTATRSRRLKSPMAQCQIECSNARQAVACPRACFQPVRFAFAFRNISSCNI
jgi:hypothetical protein